MSTSLRRLSMALGMSRETRSDNLALPVTSPSTLAQFLSTTKEKYLESVRQPQGKEGVWTVVMGNEAGDLDSVASAIAYAWIQTAVHDKPTIPLMQFERDDLRLRAENTYALELAGINDPTSQLLTLTDMKEFKPFPAKTFALVDHNRLGQIFTEGNESAQVVAVVDHHDDEGLYKDSANPRIIAPSGSCTSHIATLCPPSIPPELSTLLLCAIFIDTNGLKPGGKAEKPDHEAALKLIPLSTLASSVPLTENATPEQSEKQYLEIYNAVPVKDLTNLLKKKKSDMSHLSALDILRRDYKEYDFTLHWATGTPSIKAGLSSAPPKLKSWGSKGVLEEEAVSWMKTRGLSVLGVLTSYTSNEGKKKAKNEREMAWIILDDSALPQRSELSSFDTKDMAKRLWKGLEKDEVIKVRRHKKMDYLEKKGRLPKKSAARVYKQGNAEANRKVVAPLLRKILEATD